MCKRNKEIKAIEWKYLDELFLTLQLLPLFELFGYTHLHRHLQLFQFQNYLTCLFVAWIKEFKRIECNKTSTVIHAIAGMPNK